MLRNVPVAGAAEPVFLEVHIEFGEVEERAQMLLWLIMPGTYRAICIFIRSPKLNGIASLATACTRNGWKEMLGSLEEVEKNMKGVIIAVESNATA